MAMEQKYDTRSIMQQKIRMFSEDRSFKEAHIKFIKHYLKAMTKCING